MSLVLIRLVHVLLGIFWGGTVLFAMFYLDPAARAAGPAGGKVMQQLMKRGYMGAMTLIGLVTVLTGLYVMWRISGGFDPAYMGSVRGILISTGMLTGIGVLGVLAHMSRPTSKKLAAVAQRVATVEGEPDPADLAEMQRLRDKLTLALRIAGVLMAITLVCMAVGSHGV